MKISVIVDVSAPPHFAAVALATLSLVLKGQNMFIHRTRAARRRLLQLESLETRRCMDATMEMIGGTLFVRGSMEADQISIVDHGNGRVSASNSAFSNGRVIDYSGVEKVLVRSKKGSDDVRYSMPDPSLGVTDIVICMGPDGNNAFHFDAGPARATDRAEHHLTINGGSDTDNVDLDFSRGMGQWTIHSDLRGGDDKFNAQFSGNGAMRPHVDLNLRGGDGNDQYDLNFDFWYGDSNLELDLGQGNDQFRTSTSFIHPGYIFEFNPQPDPPGIDGSHSRVSIDAGSGDDYVMLNARGGPAELEVRADLGAGEDRLDLRTSLRAGGDSSMLPQLKVAVDAGEGNDRVTVDLPGYAGLTDLDVELGAGADHLFVLADPPPERFRARLAGGAGNDAIDVFFAEIGNARGEVECLILGGDGDDALSLNARGLGNPRLLKARVDGGSGFDRARASANVVVVNCEA